MSYAVSGIDGVVKVTPPGGTPVDMDVTGYSADIEVGEIDATTTADQGWDDSIDATKKVTGSFDFFWNPTKNPFNALVSLMPGSGVYPTLSFFVATSNNLSGVARITKLSLKSATREAKKFTASFTSKSIWTVPPA